MSLTNTDYINSTIEKKSIIIIGGGITGLSAAYSIQEQARAKGLPVSFVLVESAEQLGGKIITERVGDFTVEGGPDCFIRQKPWASELCGKIGLQTELMGTNDESRKVFVLDRGRLKQLPDGVMLIIPTRIMPFALSPLISIPGKVRMAMDWFIPRFQGDGDESVGDFVRRRLGQEALDKIAEPLMSGIHVSDPEKQSLLATFPRFRTMEQKHGSLIRGMLAERKQRANHKAQAGKAHSSIFVTLRGGLGQMVKTVEEKLVDGQVIKDEKAVHIERMAGGGYRVRLENGKAITGDALILTVPSYQAADLVRPFAADLAKDLEKIRFVSTATISLAFRKKDLGRPITGFGYVSPRKEQRKVSACTFSSIKFDHRAPADSVLIRCFVGGPNQEETVTRSDQEILQLVRKELESTLEIKAEPVLTRIYRWEKANPQYDVDHLQRVRSLFKKAEDFPGLYLAGSSYEGVGVPDCIRQGQQAAEKALLSLEQVTNLSEYSYK